MADTTENQETDLPNGTWTEALAPIVAKFNVGQALGNEVVFNPTGALALRNLISEMTRLLDEVAPTKIAEAEADRNRMAHRALQEFNEKTAYMEHLLQAISLLNKLSKNGRLTPEEVQEVKASDAALTATLKSIKADNSEEKTATLEEADEEANPAPHVREG